MQDSVVILILGWGFLRTAYLTASFKFAPGWPLFRLLPWQRNLGENRL